MPHPYGKPSSPLLSLPSFKNITPSIPYVFQHSFLFGGKKYDERKSREISHTAQLFMQSPIHSGVSSGTFYHVSRTIGSLREEEKTRAVKLGNVIHKISFSCGCCFIGYFNPLKLNLRTIQNNKGIWLNFWL